MVKLQKREMLPLSHHRRVKRSTSEMETASLDIGLQIPMCTGPRKVMNKHHICTALYMRYADAGCRDGELPHWKDKNYYTLADKNVLKSLRHEFTILK